MNSILSTATTTMAPMSQSNLYTNLMKCAQNDIAPAQEDMQQIMALKLPQPKTINDALDYLENANVKTNITNAVNSLTKINSMDKIKCAIGTDANLKTQLCAPSLSADAMLKDVDLDKLEKVLNDYDGSIKEVVRWVMNNNLQLHKFCAGDDKKMAKLTSILGKVAGYLNPAGVEGFALSDMTNPNSALFIIILVVLMCLAYYCLCKH